MSENTFRKGNKCGTEYIFNTRTLFAIAFVTILLVISSVITYCEYIGEEKTWIEALETAFTGVMSVYIGYILGKSSKKNDAEILSSTTTLDQFIDKYYGKPETPGRKKLDAGYEKFKAEALSNKYGTGKNELSSNT